MKPIEFLIKLEHPDAVQPRYAHATDGAMDMTAVSVAQTERYIEYDTGVAIALPPNTVGLLLPRSSISNKDLILANSVGVIDADYRGTIRFRFKLTADKSAVYNVGDKIGQLLIIPRPLAMGKVVKELPPSPRGTGGFGSTGA